MNNTIEIRDLTFSYAESLDGFRLGPLNMRLNSGKIYGWEGHNGSGKSTLASILAGNRRHTSGTITGLPQNVLYFQQNIAANIFPDLTVGEHLRLGKNRTQERIVLNLFPSLADQLKKFPDALSGGQLQRLAFSLTLTRSFGLYLFDEITNHLDVKTSKVVGEAMRNVVTSNPEATVVFISHDQRFLRDFTDEVLFFEEGRIGSPSNA